MFTLLLLTLVCTSTVARRCSEYREYCGWQLKEIGYKFERYTEACSGNVLWWCHPNGSVSIADHCEKCVIHAGFSGQCTCVNPNQLSSFCDTYHGRPHHGLCAKSYNRRGCRAATAQHGCEIGIGTWNVTSTFCRNAGLEEMRWVGSLKIKSGCSLTMCEEHSLRGNCRTLNHPNELGWTGQPPPRSVKCSCR